MNCELCEHPLSKKQILKKCRFCSYSCSARFHRPLGRSGKKKQYNPTRCPECMKEFHVAPSTMKLRKNGMKFCSQRCKKLHMSKNKTPWGFKFENADKTSNPRKRIQINKKRVYEHRWLMEQHIGRDLLKNEHVHHINGDPKDNRIENLQIVSPNEHAKIHKKK